MLTFLFLGLLATAFLIACVKVKHESVIMSKNVASTITNLNNLIFIVHFQPLKTEVR